ncbi:TcaA NTF2-like domain-containing protein [Alkalicoccus saliphilus]|uniref:Membrane-associated protein n=1 Tax=Alkalicoccus saliphilus TaxID=200989 RepID=A0A2T4U2Z1_9BACI|nr:hypothetical protein [Alkalicoccus saliphilus]PTL37766.1 hypothetical protein C6Y45_14755 [Alkalicoccus saliphilus]
MGYCTKCGTELDSASGKCLQCPQRHDTESSGGTPSKHRNKLFYSVGGLVLIGAAAHFMLDNYTSSDRMIENFQAAVAEGNVQEVKRYVAVKGNDTNVSTEYIEGLIAYLNEDSYIRSDFSDFIQDHLQFFESTSAAGVPGYYEPPVNLQFLSLENSGKQFLLYDSFAFYVEEYPLLVSSNYEDVAFQVDGEEVEATQQRDGTYWLGDFPAGSYDVTGTLDFDHGEASLNNDMALLSDNDQFTMDFHMEYFHLTSGVDNLELYYNGENTGEEVSKNGLEFGPVLLDSSDELHVEGEAPFGSVFSEPAEVGGDTYFTFHVKAEEEAVEDALKNLKTEVEGYGDDSYHSGYDLLGSVEVYPETQWLYEENGSWYLMLDVDEIRHDYYNETFEMHEETFPRNYTFTYNEGKSEWELHSIENYYFTDNVSGDGRTIEIKSPETLQKEVAEIQKDIEEGFLNENLHYFFEEFLEENVYAVNTGDTYYLESLIHPEAGEYKKEAFDYMDSLRERNITQSIDDIDIRSFEQEDDGTIIVNTAETYSIYYDYDSAKIKSFDSQYEVRDTSTGLKLVKLVETTETSSEDIY